jgi:hypothetical protein
MFLVEKARGKYRMSLQTNKNLTARGLSQLKLCLSATTIDLCVLSWKFYTLVTTAKKAIGLPGPIIGFLCAKPEISGSSRLDTPDEINISTRFTLEESSHCHGLFSEA